MKISRRVREQAATLCSIMACHRAAPYSYQYGSNHLLATQWAEAEALLRTGWTP